MLFVNFCLCKSYTVYVLAGISVENLYLAKTCQVRYFPSSQERFFYPLNCFLSKKVNILVIFCNSLPFLLVKLPLPSSIYNLNFSPGESESKRRHLQPDLWAWGHPGVHTAICCGGKSITPLKGLGHEIFLMSCHLNLGNFKTEQWVQDFTVLTLKLFDQ